MATVYQTAQGEWITCPVFSGDDIDQWIRAVESFLYRFQIPVEQHVNFSSHHIVGVASKWVVWNENLIAWGNWSQWLESLRMEFGETVSVSEEANRLLGRAEKEYEYNKEGYAVSKGNKEIINKEVTYLESIEVLISVPEAPNTDFLSLCSSFKSTYSKRSNDVVFHEQDTFIHSSNQEEDHTAIVSSNNRVFCNNRREWGKIQQWLYQMPSGVVCGSFIACDSVSQYVRSGHRKNLFEEMHDKVAGYCFKVCARMLRFGKMGHSQQLFDQMINSKVLHYFRVLILSKKLMLQQLKLSYEKWFTERYKITKLLNVRGKGGVTGNQIESLEILQQSLVDRKDETLIVDAYLLCLTSVKSHCIDGQNHLFVLFYQVRDGALSQFELDDFQNNAERYALEFLSLHEIPYNWFRSSLLESTSSWTGRIDISYHGNSAIMLSLVSKRRVDHKRQQSNKNMLQCSTYGPKKLRKLPWFSVFLLKPSLTNYHSTAMVFMKSQQSRACSKRFYTLKSITMVVTAMVIDELVNGNGRAVSQSIMGCEFSFTLLQYDTDYQFWEIIHFLSTISKMPRHIDISVQLRSLVDVL